MFKLFRRFYLTLSALWLGCALICTSAQADDGLALQGVTASRALIAVNNGKPHWFSLGETQAGVTLRAIDGEHVTVDFNGQPETLTLGDNDKLSGGAADADAQQIILHASSNGHFYADGTINGASARFLVDTGASTIAMNTADAQRIGIDYAKGRRVMFSTANGAAPAYLIKLDTVSVGGVTLNNVDAAVSDGMSDDMLLGMSFLSRMEMQRDGDTMTLKKRY